MQALQSFLHGVAKILYTPVVVIGIVVLNHTTTKKALRLQRFLICPIKEKVNMLKIQFYIQNL